ncbi:hypothetical protein [Pseudomonas sp. SJZ079]|uniref:hypothetical protein n=1 Tax=Pseudomonas sp. SJZ079 TaxID=2572887 RepID=UPI0011BDB8B7|nr:hypothetical protein [Pseudomonas sp. SJZ079]
MNTQAPHPPRSPRDYAAAILAEPMRERRAQLLEACPAHWRSTVREHVESAFGKIAAYRQHQASRAQLAREKPPAAPRREATNRANHHKKSTPEVGNQHLAELRASINMGAV